MAQLLPSPTTLFSPSLARQHLAQTKDWNYIDSWLTSKFAPRSPPPFERNADTLKALFALASLNEVADEERELLARIQANAVMELKAKPGKDLDMDLLERLDENMTRDAQSALQTTAELSVVLNLLVPEMERVGLEMVKLQVRNFDLEQASERVLVLENHLKGELVQTEKTITDLQSDAYQAPEDLGKQTTDFQRKSKALAAKLPEMKNRVTATKSGLGRHITIEDVILQEASYKESSAKIKDLETQVKSFHGLPQDTDLARLELEALRAELRSLAEERDRMFEGLVERESPKKSRQ